MNGAVPAEVAASVPVVALARGLAIAGLTSRYDAHKAVLVIEPAEKPRVVPMQSTHELAEALMSMAVYNGWTRAQRAHWHSVAGSAVPADAVAAYQSGAPRP